MKIIVCNKYKCSYIYSMLGFIWIWKKCFYYMCSKDGICIDVRHTLKIYNIVYYLICWFHTIFSESCHLIKGIVFKMLLVYDYETKCCAYTFRWLNNLTKKIWTMRTAILPVGSYLLIVVFNSIILYTVIFKIQNFNKLYIGNWIIQNYE